MRGVLFWISSKCLGLYLTLKNKEVQNAIPISFFPKAGDINSPNLLNFGLLKSLGIQPVYC